MRNKQKAIELTSKEITCSKEHASKPQEMDRSADKAMKSVLPMHSIENANVRNKITTCWSNDKNDIWNCHIFCVRDQNRVSAFAKASWGERERKRVRALVLIIESGAGRMTQCTLFNWLQFSAKRALRMWVSSSTLIIPSKSICTSDTNQNSEYVPKSGMFAFCCDFASLVCLSALNIRRYHNKSTRKNNLIRLHTVSSTNTITRLDQ